MTARRSRTAPSLGRRSFLTGMGALGTLGACGGSGDGGTVARPVQTVQVASEAASIGVPAAVRVGLFVPLTGPTADFGLGVKAGCELALEGATLGDVKLLVEDSAGAPDRSDAAVERLLGAGAHVLIGDVSSSGSKRAGAIAQRAETPMISPAATEASVTQIGDYIFRACLTDADQAQMAAAFIESGLEKVRVGLLRMSGNAYSDTLAAAFVAAAPAHGLNVVDTISLGAHETSFGEHLKRLTGAGAEIIYAPLFYDTMLAIAADARTLGIPGTQFVGGDGYSGPGLYRALPGAYFTDHFAVDSTEPETTSFVAAFQRHYGEPPTALAAVGFDAMVFVLDAVARSGKGNKRAIRDALASSRDLQGATGRMSMGPSRDPVKAGVVIQMADETVRFVRRVGP